MQKNKNRKYFLFPLGAIGVEIFAITTYHAIHKFILRHDCVPVVLFITKASNETLLKLIKRKLDEMGVVYKDLNNYSGIKKIRKHIFSNLLSITGSVADCAYSVGNTKRFIDIFFNSKNLVNSHKYVLMPINPMDQDYIAAGEVKLCFNEEENAYAKLELKKMGIETEHEYVCVHSRDNAYADSLIGRHNDDARNSSFKTYSKACKYLENIAIYTTRMGSVQSSVDESLFSEYIVNYSGRYRTDFMDIWLMSRAKFIIGNSSGFNMIGYLFGSCVPLIWADAGAILTSTAWGEKDLYIPQRLWLKREKRFLTFQEIADRNLGYSFESYQFEKNGLEVIKSSDVEILEATKEMNDVLDGKYIYTEEDNFLCQKWKDAFLINQAPKHTPARVSLSFLRENKKLFIQ